MTYIYRHQDGNLRLADELHARYQRKHREKARQTMRPFREVEDAGPNRSRLTIHVIGSRGERGLAHCENTAKGVKRAVRKVRPEEQAELDRIDSELARLREERRETIRRAWAKGHVVTLKEVRETLPG